MEMSDLWGWKSC